MAKKPKPFHNPFEGLKLPPKPAPEPAPPPRKAEAAPAAAPRRFEDGLRRELTEEDLWAIATEGAAPLADRSPRIRPGPEPIARAPSPLDPELQAYDELRALVGGEVAFDLSDSDEFIEGHAHGLDPNVLRRLRRGEYALQSHLDLHGMVKDEARAALEAFVSGARSSGKRCVLVVHGRGLHSKDHVPVLKEAFKRWMATARFAQHVLAFCTARPHDGGAGAVYLLLRR